MTSTKTRYSVFPAQKWYSVPAPKTKSLWTRKKHCVSNKENDAT